LFGAIAKTRSSRRPTSVCRRNGPQRGCREARWQVHHALSFPPAHGRSIIGLARSYDGYRFTVDPEPFLIPDREGPFAAYEEYGVEDPRITQLDGEYLITYSAYSRNGVRIALAKTKNFQQVEKTCFITQADYRNVVIFPEKFDGLYARLDRPHSEIAPWSIWISYSPDLRFWGESQLIMKPERYHWTR